jgi:hypothetical protein
VAESDAEAAGAFERREPGAGFVVVDFGLPDAAGVGFDEDDFGVAIRAGDGVLDVPRSAVTLGASFAAVHCFFASIGGNALRRDWA